MNVSSLINVIHVQPVTLPQWFVLVGTALVAWGLYRKRRRDSYPSYHEIPATILTHMPLRKELEALNGKVDVIVSLSTIVPPSITTYLPHTQLTHFCFVLADCRKWHRWAYHGEYSGTIGFQSGRIRAALYGRW